MIRKTIPILFPGGAYGTYLEWVLTTLTSDTELISPFESTGSSHQFCGNHLLGFNSLRWHKFVEDDKFIPFVRLHPKTRQEESLSNNLLSILGTVENIIHLYPDKNSVLLTINNAHSKVWSNWFSNRMLDPVFSKNLYDNWPIVNDTVIEDLPIWIMREILSFNLMPSWQAEVEWYHPDKWSDDRCQLILVKDLLYNFEYTINQLQKSFDLDFKKSVKELLPYHASMLHLQLSLTQDQLCSNIVNSIVSDTKFDWCNQSLPLASQAWIQWQLRNLNYELRCHELDIFPTNSVQLKQLLYIP
jgi:hypothetical protein